MGVGFYVKVFMENEILGNKIIGIAVLAVVFVLMPIFLYVRLHKKKLKDYTFTPENIKKMRDGQEN